MRITLIVLLIFLLCPAGAQEWTQWRGSQREGVSTHLLPPKLPKALTLRWKTAVGDGYASPVLQDGLTYCFSRNDGKEMLLALRVADGGVAWRTGYPAPFNTNQYALKFGKGPFSTPAVSAEGVITLGVSAVLTCYDRLDGHIRWQIGDTLSPPNSGTFFVGIAASPLLVDSLCIAFTGDEDTGKLAAYRRDDGREMWSWRGDRPGYASPVIAEIAGVRQVVTQSQTRVVGLRLRDGQLLWELPFESKWKENIVSPLIIDDLLIYSGVRRGIHGVRISQTDNGWHLQPLWENEQLAQYMNTGVGFDGLLFGFSHRQKGQFFCLDIHSGAQRWVSEGRQGANAAMVRSGERIAALRTDGQLLIFPAIASSFSPSHIFEVAASQTWAHPVLLADGLLIRDATHLIRWDYSISNP